MDTLVRCFWCGNDDLYVKYHDEEWGKPVHDDRTLFEYITLEGAQAGLSWITILRKREAYRAAFLHFDVHKIAQFTEQDIERILREYNIVRHRGKVASVISNAKAFIAIQKEFGSFDTYLWSFLPNGYPIINSLRKKEDIVASTPLSDTISKDLKKRGFKFFGTTICYAFMQAIGMVNDHFDDCFAKNYENFTCN